MVSTRRPSIAVQPQYQQYEYLRKAEQADYEAAKVLDEE